MIEYRAGMRLACIICLGLTACQQQSGFLWGPPPKAYLDPRDQLIARTGNRLPDRPVPCGTEVKGPEITYIEVLDTDHCVKMDPPRRWRGYWHDEFEGQSFCIGSPTNCSLNGRPNVWLTRKFEFPAGTKRCNGKVWALDFIGRKTKYEGGYGHMGFSRFEIIADKLISMREVTRLRPERCTVKEAAQSGSE